MKWHALLLLGLLTTSRAASGPEATAQPAPVPATIVLDGVISIPGGNWAFFRISFSGNMPGADFMLAEGQSRYGIQLLAVNTPAGTVTVRKQGQTQTLSICQPPALLATTGSDSAAAGRPSPDANAAAAGMAASIGGKTQSAAVPRFAHPVNAAGWDWAYPRTTAATNPGDNPVTANNADVGNANGAAGTSGSATQEHLYQWWTKEAQKIEQARLDTAQRVLAGEWPAYPLTPLTPSDTPSQLIGPDSLFMEHGPGMLVSGN